jgi:hypothetical protein
VVYDTWVMTAMDGWIIGRKDASFGAGPVITCMQDERRTAYSTNNE